MKLKLTYSSTAHTITAHDWYLPQPKVDDDPAVYAGRVARFARQCSGLTQAEVARQAGVTQAYVSRVERGRWQSVKKFSRYLGAYGLALDLDFVRDGDAK